MKDKGDVASTSDRGEPGTGDGASAAEPLLGCSEVCRRCRRLVAAIARVDHGGTIYRSLGPHLRHCLDHIVALLRGLADGVVDYDARDRDPEIERDPERFLAALAAAESGLGALDGQDLSRPIEVVQLSAPEARPLRLTSTLARELVFLSSHTIHHLALMLHLARSHGVEVEESLGVAFSTEAYRASAEVASR